ncbi:MAG: hypothetical protein JWO95_3447 [Verrucomicrobiales bacterium]|nr:hypothetical protein [Verrucomicrobiales bacterium]
MRRHICTVLLYTSVLFTLSTVAFAQSAATGLEAKNKALLHATAPYEDVIEPALHHDNAKIAKMLAAADQDVAATKAALPGTVAKKFDNLRAKLHKAADAQDGRAIAANAVEIFRLIVDQLATEALTVPIEVELMDYAGYKMQVLAAAENPDWVAIKKITDDNDNWWQAIAKSKVTNKQLRASVNSAVRGAKQAADEKNVGMLKFGAQMVLDLVDVLEVQFKYPLADKPAPKAKS